MSQVSLMILGVLLILVAIVLVYWNGNYSKEHNRFTKEMKKRAERQEKISQTYTKEEIERLPKALKEYLNFVGLEGSIKKTVQHVVFDHTRFVFDEKTNKILDMNYDLWLFTDKLYRQAFCSAKMFGIPFEGIDYYDDAKNVGGMKGFLGKAIQIFDQPVEDMQRVVYITILAESAMMNPGFLLSPYITYEEVDDQTVKAKITYKGVSGHGVFKFDKVNETLTFYSDERQGKEERNGEMVAVGWKCIGSGFRANKDVKLKLATHAQAIKVYPDKELVYFDSKQIQYK